MAHFPFTSLTDNGTPRVGKTAYHGPSISGVHALQRNIIQFLNGAPIVDYSSLTYTATGTAADGKVLAIDSRAGNQLGAASGATSGHTPNVAETWTITFSSSTEYTISGSVSGAQAGTFTVGTDAIVADLIYVHIAASTANLWQNGDTITVDFVANTNTAALTKWTDPDPQKGYIQSGTEHAVVTDEPTNGATPTEKVANMRVLYSDPVGADTATDYVYMGVGAYDYEIDSGTSNTYCLFTRGYLGWSASGAHATPSEGKFLPLEVVGDIGGHLICDQYRWTAALTMGGAWTYNYVGQIDAYMTKEEFAYPFINAGAANNPQRWSDTATTSGWDNISSGNGPSGSGSTENWEGFSVDGAWKQPASYVSEFETYTGINRLYPFDKQRTTSSLFAGYKGSCNFAPPRVGDSQIPLIPVSCMNFPSSGNGSENSQLVGATHNMFTAQEVYGVLRGLYAAPMSFTSEGDTVTVGSDTYLIIGGKNSTSGGRFDANGFNHRAAIKLS